MHDDDADNKGYDDACPSICKFMIIGLRLYITVATRPVWSEVEVVNLKIRVYRQ